jgi:hypothetical protein
MLPTKFQFIWPSGFGKYLKKLANQKQEILIFFLAHLAKGNVGFWHHLASIVCCLSFVNFSHFNLLL